MNDNGAYVVRMGFKGGDSFRGIVIIDSDVEIIGAANNPILPRYEAACSNRDVA